MQELPHAFVRLKCFHWLLYGTTYAHHQTLYAILSLEMFKFDMQAVSDAEAKVVLAV